VSGDRLLHLARAWFAEDIVTRVFEPLVADWQIEHAALRGFACLRSTLRIWFCFAMTAALMLPWQLKQRLPERVTLGGWIVTEAFVVVGVMAQWYLFFDANPRGASHLLPGLLSTALPLALIPAAFVVSRLGTPVEARTTMVRLTLIVMLCLAPLLAWWLPAANQAWRVAHAGEGVRRGDREVTLLEIMRAEPPKDFAYPRRSVIVAAPEIEADWNDVRRQVLIERASVLLMPVTLCLLAIAMSSVIQRRRTLAGLIMWALTAGVWLTMLDITPWGAHAVFLDAAFLFYVYDRRTPRNPRSQSA
jgi:hypothetical protein